MNKGSPESGLYISGAWWQLSKPFQSTSHEPMPGLCSMVDRLHQGFLRSLWLRAWIGGEEV